MGFLIPPLQSTSKLIGTHALRFKPALCPQVSTTFTTSKGVLPVWRMRARFDQNGAEYITLESFLKVHQLADTGGQAKLRIVSGQISVNDHVETRRGRKLRHGDSVSVDNRRIQVAFTSADDFDTSLQPSP